MRLGTQYYEQRGAGGSAFGVNVLLAGRALYTIGFGGGREVKTRRNTGRIDFWGNGYLEAVSDTEMYCGRSPYPYVNIRTGSGYALDTCGRTEWTH